MIRVSLKSVSVLLLGVLVAPVAAQIPDEFTNLKIFPETLDAALGRYDELREEHYGSAAYDFSPGTLNSVAEKLAQEKGDVQGAIAIVRANLVHHPTSAYTHLMLGQLLAQSGDKQAAVQSIQRAIELEPDNHWAKQLLERLQSSE